MSRVGFLGRLIDKAAENGNTIYEELQGNSVIASAVADWKEIAKDTAHGVKEDLDTAAAWISPTIDATPGKRTLEDTIDEFIFDPKSELAPLELVALGAASTSKAALTGMQAAAKKVGLRVDDLVQGSRLLRNTKTVVTQPRRVAEGVANRATLNLADVAEKNLRVQLGKATPELRAKLMELYPEIKKTAGSWDEFAEEIFVKDPEASRALMSKAGKAADITASGIQKAKRFVDDVFPKAVGDEPPPTTVEGDLLKAPFLSFVGGRERARKYFDE